MMSSSGEVDTQAPPMEQPPIPASEATAEQPVAAAAEAKEEEETASKEKKPKAPAHPPYFQVIQAKI